MAALRRLLRRRKSPPVTTADGLADFLSAQTAYVAQRTVIEYCRARAGLNWDKLFAERSFLERLEVCRWEGYAVVLAELAELALIRLRRDGAADPQAYLPALVQSAHAALLRHPVPSHRASWSDAADAIEQHLAHLARASFAVRAIREPRADGQARPAVVVFHAVRTGRSGRPRSMA